MAYAELLANQISEAVKAKKQQQRNVDKGGFIQKLQYLIFI